MQSINKRVLTINGGSSSIKFSVYLKEETLKQLFTGELESIGKKGTKIVFHNNVTGENKSADIKVADHAAAASAIIECLENQASLGPINAIGHRIVQGLDHTLPELITPGLLTDLKKFSAYDPEHLPKEIELIEMFSARYPALQQIACFDTCFHASMPLVAKWLAIPRAYYAMGIRRYGFHGLSYAYLMEQLNLLPGGGKAKGRILLAHLGSGASLAAVKDGRSMDTSMGFTPSSGLPMSSRTGDLDPGVAAYLMDAGKCSPAQFSHLVNHESGLVGISETSADMRELLQLKSTDTRAAEAIDLFCYQTRKWIGSFAVVLGGLDTLVFSGGIGEHSPEIRKGLCENLTFLGIELDQGKNERNEDVISADTSKVCIRVMKTNEELMIAKLVCGVLQYV